MICAILRVIKLLLLYTSIYLRRFMIGVPHPSFWNDDMGTTRFATMSLNDILFPPPGGGSIDLSVHEEEGKRSPGPSRFFLPTKIRCVATRDRQIERGRGQTEREEKPRRIKEHPVQLDTLTHRLFALRYRVNKVPGIRVYTID